MTDAVSVALRVRPFSDRERLEGCEPAITPVDERTLLVGADRQFTFDRCFGPTTAQDAVYAGAVQPLVRAFLDGYNATVFAYGQTGSGKTHTMMGTADCAAAVTDGSGVIPRVVAAVFASMRELADTVEFAARLSFCEVYNDDLRDLLDGEHGDKGIAVREDPSGQIIIVGLKEVDVSSAEEVAAVLREGSARRATGATKMNAQSSRSHAVCTLTLEQIPRSIEQAEGGVDTAACKVSKFHMVDLAGRYDTLPLTVFVLCGHCARILCARVCL